MPNCDSAVPRCPPRPRPSKNYRDRPWRCPVCDTVWTTESAGYNILFGFDVYKWSDTPLTKPTDKDTDA